MTEVTSITIFGCGYIGKLLARQLLDKNIPTNGIVHSDASLAECEDRDIPCSMLDLDRQLQEIDMSGHRVIYLAPPPGKGKTDTRMTNFLHAIENHAPEKFVLISTTGVYGNCNGEWINETRLLNPTADRVYRRVDAEQQVQQYCLRHDVSLVMLRVAGIYGPGKTPVERIKSGQPVVNAQDSPFTNRIHALDLVNICETALLNPDIAGIYNVTDGHPGTMYEYFTGVARAMSLPAPPELSLAEARHKLSEGMLSYMAESRRISNKKLLNDFQIELRYPTLKKGLKAIT